MEFTLWNTIKENWIEMLIVFGMMYGVLFGVFLGLIFFTTDEKENHLPIWSDITLSLIISGLTVLIICSYIIVMSNLPQHNNDKVSRD